MASGYIVRQASHRAPIRSPLAKEQTLSLTDLESAVCEDQTWTHIRFSWRNIPITLKPLNQRHLPVPRCFTIGDVQLRHAEPADAIAVALVHVRSWQAAYRKLMPDEYLDQLRPEDRAKKYNFGSLDPLKPHTIVWTESGVIRGFATTAPAQDLNMPDYGELCALYVDPNHWGQGIGVALVSAARARLFDLGFQKAILWVLEGNVRAERFYGRDRWGPGWSAANGRSVGPQSKRGALSAQPSGPSTWTLSAGDALMRCKR